MGRLTSKSFVASACIEEVVFQAIPDILAQRLRPDDAQGSGGAVLQHVVMPQDPVVGPREVQVWKDDPSRTASLKASLRRVLLGEADAAESHVGSRRAISGVASSIASRNEGARRARFSVVFTERGASGRRGANLRTSRSLRGAVL
jgi:hypothetical protein